MSRLVSTVLLAVALLAASAGSAAAASDQAADRACVGQFTSEAVQIDALRPAGLTVVSPAAHQPGFGNEQSYVAVHCATELFAKRYQI